ncbi:MAG: anaerobic ribonucleoside-triphosphate reductase activating protein [Clostridia bacterium]|nr:anaerobic ribonucleoside-triphosphate reductase activating protein [Clostridia bacterium]
MKINGLQKLTLLDFPGHCACTVFLAGCDLNCPFCHNSELIPGNAPAVMESDELLSFLKKRTGVLDGVAFTGGEPLLRPGLEELIREIRALGYAVKLDTNGCHPERLERLLTQHLVDYVAMDIKNSPDRYAETCGVSDVDTEKIRRSIALLVNGETKYEFRTTVVAQLHDAASFEAIGPMIRGAKRYFLQAFTDRDTVPFEGFTAPEKAELEAYADIVRPYVGEVSLRGV